MFPFVFVNKCAPPQVLNVILKERVLQKKLFFKTQRCSALQLDWEAPGNTGPAVAFLAGTLEVVDF